MGIAAYNRGTRAVTAAVNAARPSPELILLRDLSDYSAEHDGTVGLAATVIRFGPLKGEVSIMNRQAGGWSQRCYSYGSLWELARHWRLTFLSIGKDQHSRFIVVEPLPKVVP